MDANQRSEMNNQTNNGANEKWNANAKGKTAPDAPLDHTYPQGASQQQGHQGIDQMETRQSGMGPGQRHDETEVWQVPGGSMQSQQYGGRGATQGITDSHQRQMEQRSGAYGQLEQPVGHRDRDSGTDLLRHGSVQSAQGMNPQDPHQPALQGGSLGRHHDAGQSMGSSRQDGSQQGGRSAQAADAGGTRQSTDRAGSQTGEAGRETGSLDAGGVRQSNDLAGGLPRSPGKADPRAENPGALPGAGGQQNLPGVHESNDAAGGYPASPAGSNKLAGDRKMDDDTGFSRQ